MEAREAHSVAVQEANQLRIQLAAEAKPDLSLKPDDHLGIVIAQVKAKAETLPPTPQLHSALSSIEQACLLIQQLQNLQQQNTPTKELLSAQPPSADTAAFSLGLNTEELKRSAEAGLHNSTKTAGCCNSIDISTPRLESPHAPPLSRRSRTPLAKPSRFGRRSSIVAQRYGNSDQEEEENNQEEVFEDTASMDSSQFGNNENKGLASELLRPTTFRADGTPDRVISPAKPLLASDNANVEAGSAAGGA